MMHWYFTLEYLLKTLTNKMSHQGTQSRLVEIHYLNYRIWHQAAGISIFAWLFITGNVLWSLFWHLQSRVLIAPISWVRQRVNQLINGNCLNNTRVFIGAQQTLSTFGCLRNLELICVSLRHLLSMWKVEVEVGRRQTLLPQNDVNGPEKNN